MTASRSLYNIINGVEKKPAKAKREHYKWIKPPPVGHYLAINVYKEGIYQDTLFIDHIDSCERYTMIHFNKRLMECYAVRRTGELIDVYGTWLFFENNTDFEIIRIS